MKKEFKIFIKFFLATFLFVLTLNIVIPIFDHRNFLESVFNFFRSFVSGRDFYIGWIILLFPYMISRIFVYLKKVDKKRVLIFLYKFPIFLFVYACFYAVAFLLPLSLLTIGFDSLWGYLEWDNFARNTLDFYLNKFSLYILPILILFVTIAFFKKLNSFEKNLKRLKSPKLIGGYLPFRFRNFHPQFFPLKYFSLIQQIAVFTFLVMLVKLMFFIVNDFNFLAYVTRPFTTGINLPQLDVHSSKNYAYPSVDIFITIDSKGNIKINNIHYSLKETETIFKNIHQHLSKERYGSSFYFRGQRLSFWEGSKIIFIIDVDCEMQHIQPVLNMLATSGLNQVIFLTK